MKKTFENYLQEEFLKDWHGDKDDAEQAFDAWLERKDMADIILLADAVVADLLASYDRLAKLAEKLQIMNEQAIAELKVIQKMAT
jgi:phage-related protein